MSSQPLAVAIIPARGGSKGLVRKNVLRVAGTPLVAYAIEQARSAASVARVLVSTEDEEIAEASLRHGAEVIRRPANLSTDTASSESVLWHALEYLGQQGCRPDLMVFMQCTSPLILSNDIDDAIELLKSEDADCAFAASPFHGFLWERDGTGQAVGINHDSGTRLRRQDVEPQFIEAGAFYVMRAEGFRQARHRFFGKVVISLIPRERAWEVDEPADVPMIELLLRQRVLRDRLVRLPDSPQAVIMDFDGVLTDNRVLVCADGSEAVLANRSDGMGLAQLRAHSVRLAVISAEANPVVQARCRKLRLECISGADVKAPVLMAWLDRHGIDAGAAIYVGNDVNDLPCLAMVGCGVAVRDAHPEVRAAARLVLDAPGGRGAIRELCDLVIMKMGGMDRGASRIAR